MASREGQVVFKDDLYQVGHKTVRLNSIEHLRIQNSCRHMSREETRHKLAAFVEEPHGAARLACERLAVVGKQETDMKILAALIHDGHMYGLGASPQVPVLGDLLWHAAAFILEDHAISHPNELVVQNS